MEFNISGLNVTYTIATTNQGAAATSYIFKDANTGATLQNGASQTYIWTRIAGQARAVYAQAYSSDVGYGETSNTQTGSIPAVPDRPTI